MAGEDLGPDEEITTPVCAARRDVSRATIFNAIKRGEIPYRRVGRDYLIRVADCDAFTPTKDPHEKGRRSAAKRWGNREEKAE